ncbi:MAG: N-acyl amino acid synthase FeeM domain-containing protein [Mesorhizobium sp.]
MNAYVVRQGEVSGGEANRAGSGGLSAFALNVFSVLERTEYRRIDSGEDLESIYRLRYKSYRAAGMVSDNPDRMVRDDLDDAPNCHRFGVYIDGLLVSTIRIHHVSTAHPMSPSYTVYGDILAPRLAAGDTFVDPSRFAADPEWSQVYPQIPYLTLRLAGMACYHFDAPYCLSTIKEEHTGFYRRIYMSEQIGPKRDYPGLNYPVVLYQANVHAIEERSFARFPFFRSTALERRLLFGSAVRGEVGSLTILPTARYMKTAA